MIRIITRIPLIIIRIIKNKNNIWYNNIIYIYSIFYTRTHKKHIVPCTFTESTVNISKPDPPRETPDFRVVSRRENESLISPPKTAWKTRRNPNWVDFYCGRSSTSKVCQFAKMSETKFAVDFFEKKDSIESRCFLMQRSCSAKRKDKFGFSMKKTKKWVIHGTYWMKTKEKETPPKKWTCTMKRDDFKWRGKRLPTNNCQVQTASFRGGW